jgi:hypothetical protein
MLTLNCLECIETRWYKFDSLFQEGTKRVRTADDKKAWQNNDI